MAPIARPLWILLAVVALTLPAAARADDLPIFDAHMHYSRGAWDVFPPARVIEKMKAAGVTGALVSSTPDDGTQKLLDAAPGKFVGGFRPYEDSADLGRWYERPELLAYSRQRLAQGRHQVFGEIHLHRPEVTEMPGLGDFIALVRQRGLFFHVHSDAAVVAALLDKWPDLKIIWAHAGMSDGAAVVGRTLDTYPSVMAELSYRAHDIMPGTAIEPEWRDILLRHADRFMIATDTWETDRWAGYGDLIGAHRAWLRHLPADVAARIAHKNAEKLFGSRR